MAAGSGETRVLFVDVGSAPCTLSGTPPVQFIGTDGQVLTGLVVTGTALDAFPVWPNDGVGLIPMAAGSSPRMVRGQAALSLQYTHLMCATHIAAMQVTLPTGTLTVNVRLQGFDNAACVSPKIDVNAFEPAEAYR